MHGNTFGDVVGRDDERQPGIARQRNLTARGRPDDEDACGRELGTQRERLAEPSRRTGVVAPARERGIRAVDGAVTVAVRLHDGPQLGAVERAQQRGDVAAQRAQVDRDLAASLQRRALQAMAGECALQRRQQVGGDQAGLLLDELRSDAVRDCAVRPARRGSIPLARKAATIPVRTSPVPAVASDGVP